MINQIRKDYRYRQPASISTYNTTEGRSHKDLQEENASFIWLQLFLDIVIRLTSEAILNGKEELIAYLRPMYSRVQSEKDRLNEFQQTYTPDKSVYWYTKDGCIYSELNRALRSANWEILTKYRFFIHDLHKQLLYEQHTNKRFLALSVIHLYRGQLISAAEIRKLQNAIGQYISVNSFFSTSKNKRSGLQYVTPCDENDALQSILYEIEVDTRLKSLKPYASISHLSDFGEGEHEVLFMLGTVFRVLCVERDDEGKFWLVKLQLSIENVQQLSELYRYRRNELRFQTNLEDLYTLLAEMGVLNNKTNNVLPYHRIDRYKQGEWQRTEDTEASNRLVQGVMKLVSIVSPTEAAYNRLGLQYLKTGDFGSALENLKKVLSMQQENYGGDQNIQVANTHHNLGRVYEMNEDYTMTMFHYNSSIQIRTPLCRSQEECLNLAESYKCIANVHYYLKKYQLALSSDEKALTIYTEVIPNDDLNKAKLYHRAGIIYEEMNEKEKALEYYRKTFLIYKKIYPFNDIHDTFHHQNLLMIDINRRLLRTLDTVKKTKDLEEFEEYYRKYNEDRKRGKISLQGEVLSWQINDMSR